MEKEDKRTFYFGILIGFCYGFVLYKPIIKLLGMLK